MADEDYGDDDGFYFGDDDDYLYVEDAFAIAVSPFHSSCALRLLRRKQETAACMICDTQAAALSYPALNPTTAR